jgi:hypothetical protein
MQRANRLRPLQLLNRGSGEKTGIARLGFFSREEKRIDLKYYRFPSKEFKKLADNILEWIFHNN